LSSWGFPGHVDQAVVEDLCVGDDDDRIDFLRQC
jgi:hypothetical protein